MNFFKCCKNRGSRQFLTEFSYANPSENPYFNPYENPHRNPNANPYENPYDVEPPSYDSIFINSPENSSIIIVVVSRDTEFWREYKTKNFSGRYQKVEIVNDRPAYKVSFCCQST